MKLTVLFILVLFLMSGTITAQRQFYAGIGFSNYESGFVHVSTAKNKSLYGLTASYNFHMLHENFYSYSAEYFRKISADTGHFLRKNWFVPLKVTYLDYWDSYYIFRNLSINPGIARMVSLSKRHILLFDAGPVFNIVLSYTRRTDNAVGWPYKVSMAFRVRYMFGLKS